MKSGETTPCHPQRKRRRSGSRYRPCTRWKHKYSFIQWWKLPFMCTQHRLLLRPQWIHHAPRIAHRQGLCRHCVHPPKAHQQAHHRDRAEIQQEFSSAIAQIKSKQYPDMLKNYCGKILLVGITYNKTSKQHTCRIEQVFWNFLSVVLYKNSCHRLHRIRGYDNCSTVSLKIHQLLYMLLIA